MKEDTKELLVVGCAVVAFTALGFMAGLIFGTRKRTRMVVTEKGELVKQEVEDDV